MRLFPTHERISKAFLKAPGASWILVRDHVTWVRVHEILGSTQPYGAHTDSIMSSPLKVKLDPATCKRYDVDWVLA